MRGSAIFHRFFRGALWSVVSTIIGKGGVIVLTAMAARSLSTLEFSRFALMLGAVAVAQALSTLSIGSAATRAIAAHRAGDPSRAWKMGSAAMILSCVTASIGSVGLLAWLAFSERSSSLGSAASVAVATIVWGLVLRGVLGGVVTGFEQWRTIAASNTVAGTAMIVGAFTAPGNAGPTWFLSAHAISQLLAVAVLGRKARLSLSALDVTGAARSVDYETWRALLRFSLPTFVLGAIPAVSYFVVQHWLERGDATGMALATFGIAWQLGNMVLMIPSVVSRSFMPVVASLELPRTSVGALRFVARLTAPGALIAAVAALPLLIAPRSVLSLYAPEYATESASHAVRWMAGWSILAAATIAVEFVAVSRATLRFALTSRLAWFGIVLALLVASFPRGTDSVGSASAAYMVASAMQLLLLLNSVLRGSLSNLPR